MKIMIIMCVYEVRMTLKILARIERFFSRNLWLKCFFVAVEIFFFDVRHGWPEQQVEFEASAGDLTHQSWCLAF